MGLWLFSYVVDVAAHLLRKYKKFHKKSPILNEHHYSNNLLFFQSEYINLMSSDCPINLRKERLQADV